MADDVQSNDQIPIDKEKEANLDFLFDSRPIDIKQNPNDLHLHHNLNQQINHNEENQLLRNKVHHQKLLSEDMKDEQQDQNININDNKNNNNLNMDINLNQNQQDLDQIDNAHVDENKKINIHNKDRVNYIKNLKSSQHATSEHAHLKSQSFLFVLITVILCQLGIWYWKKRHKKSFFMATLLGLWLFPVGMSIQLRYYRMIFIWVIFSIIMCILLNMSRTRPMNRKTPRYLYSWFYFLYKVTSILSIVGYALFLFDFFGIGLLIFGPHPSEERQYRQKLLHHQHSAHMHAVHDDDINSYSKEMELEKHEIDELSHYHHIHFSDIGVYLLFYGLYFGVLSRDTAQLCADWISSALGFFNPSGFPRRRVPTNICAVCNNPLANHDIFSGGDDSEEKAMMIHENDSSTQRRMKLMMQRRKEDKLKEIEMKKKQQQSKNKCFKLCSLGDTVQDESVAINCGHRFHGFCIRGWIMIGKRDVCPVCKEKVNLKGIFANPWQKQDRMWSQLLDGVRYLMVWNPAIVLCANLVFSASGLSFAEKHTTPKPAIIDTN